MSQILTHTGGIAHVPGTGTIKVVKGSTPSAGADCYDKVPTGKYWLIQTAQYTLTTSATVASRNFRIGFSDNSTATSPKYGNEFYSSASTGTQAASLTYTYAVSELPFASGTAQNDVPIPIAQMILPPGAAIYTITQSKQSGDQFSAPIFLVEEWNA